MQDVMASQSGPQRRVAVVGSGLAGLTAAYLLQGDARQRYAVTILESGPRLSLDSASISVSSDGNETLQRIDVPMRGLTGGYYRNLFALYRHLGIACERKKFRFTFASTGRTRDGPDETYFIHASDNHQIPPPRPPGVGIWGYLVELLFVVVCFAYFTLCCGFVAPRSTTIDGGETFHHYLRRTRIPTRFACRYLIPLMSSIATCTHAELLDFPASDIVNYRKQIVNGKQFVVTGGVCSVEKSLVKGITDVRTGTRVIQVEPLSSGIRVVTQTENYEVGGSNAEDQVNTVSEVFDEVILAVPPSVVASIFVPARKQLQEIPVRSIQTIVRRISESDQSRNTNSRHSQVEDIRLKTMISAGEPQWTEATHVQYGQFAVTSSPFGAPCASLDVLATAQFTRTLRTPESRRITEHMFSGRTEKMSDKDWANGTNHVWLVGAWCWDGMVLLEGAVVSAMRVAEALTVKVPWEEEEKKKDKIEERGQSRLFSWCWLSGKCAIRRLQLVISSCSEGRDKID